MNFEKIPEKVLSAMDEYVQRHRLGENADISDYIDKFPEWETELKDHQFMCDVFKKTAPLPSILSDAEMEEIWNSVLPHFEKNVQASLQKDKSADVILLWESLQDMWEWLKQMTAYIQQQMETSPAMGEEETALKFPADFPELVKFGYDETALVSVTVEEAEDQAHIRGMVELMPSFEENIEPQPCALLLQSADERRALGEFKEDQLRVKVEIDLPASELDKYTLVLEPITSGCGVEL